MYSGVVAGGVGVGVACCSAVAHFISWNEIIKLVAGNVWDFQEVWSKEESAGVNLASPDWSIPCEVFLSPSLFFSVCLFDPQTQFETLSKLWHTNCAAKSAIKTGPSNQQGRQEGKGVDRVAKREGQGGRGKQHWQQYDVMRSRLTNESGTTFACWCAAKICFWGSTP